MDTEKAMRDAMERAVREATSGEVAEKIEALADEARLATQARIDSDTNEQTFASINDPVEDASAAVREATNDALRGAEALDLKRSTECLPTRRPPGARGPCRHQS